ncbi:MFS transporter [Thalassospira sp. GO-4]|jgi:predicted MFS family arabinose efflux permease|uniref:MFS transporter n=1 Tax=Thalassospira sp. GO-4 TaxID=2946605 RepID=UPI002024ECDD|nr:MFS transporter [Thalassospira sp. GO-4]URK18565.1 MFS transporter [Thalassospira sp. GO-4]
MLLLTNGAVRLLFIAQALYWSCSLIGITLTALVGVSLAPSTGLATLPLGVLMLGNLISVHPLAMVMQRRGRRVGLFLGALCGVAGGLLLAAGIYIAQFWLVALAPLLIGTYQASAMYYRYAAIEAVDKTQSGRASALVVGGGVLAALVAPEIAGFSSDFLPVPFAGAYVALAGLAAMAAIITIMLPDGGIPARSGSSWTVMATLLRRPVIRGAIAVSAAGHGIMILVMTATPLAMKYCGFDIDVSANVIRWHLIGMFLPAFVAGPMIDRFGAHRVASLGVGILLISVGFAVTGISAEAFLTSSFLLGIGWNMMLLAGTTMLGAGHDPSERGHAQSLMELGNSITATAASIASGALIAGAGWIPVNYGVVPVLVGAMILMWRGLVAQRSAAQAGA